jgi:HSP90 family molecular chaperone
MVGDRVDVHSRSAKGGDATIWSSDGSGQFTVKTVAAEVSTSFIIQFLFTPLLLCLHIVNFVLVMCV